MSNAIFNCGELSQRRLMDENCPFPCVLSSFLTSMLHFSMTIATMMQTLRAQVFTLAEEPVDGAAAADFSEGFEADTAGAGVGFTPAEEGAEATIIAEAETTGGTGGTGGTLPTVGDSQTGFGGGVSARANSNPEMMLFYEPLCSFF